MTPRTVLLLALAAFTAFGCRSAGSEPPRPASSQAGSPGPEQRGLAFAQQRCASCHAVGGGLSPNAEAPSFEALINAPGVQLATLKPWLQNSHNFPAAMNFTIAPDEIDELAAYMLTLKDPRFRPQIQ